MIYRLLNGFGLPVPADMAVVGNVVSHRSVEMFAIFVVVLGATNTILYTVDLSVRSRSSIFQLMKQLK